jgi:hypothetical protein
MSDTLPAPQFKGFTILKFDLQTDSSENKEALFDAEYQTTPFSMDYDATKWTYWFCLKVEYPGPFPPGVFAILYEGDTREDDTSILPLVSPGIGPKNNRPMPSIKYDTTLDKTRSTFMIAMQERNPDNDLKDYYYGFLQLDYHYNNVSYQPGTHTVEFMLGWGEVEAQPDQWTDVLKCQWDITAYTPAGTPSATKKAGTTKKKKTKKTKR